MGGEGGRSLEKGFVNSGPSEIHDQIVDSHAASARARATSLVKPWRLSVRNKDRKS